MERRVLEPVLRLLDEVRSRQEVRFDGLSRDEYLWEPAEACWSVHDRGGGWDVDPVPPVDPEPSPVTTIAWRLWHIASDCLASYTSRGLGPWPIEVEGVEWYGEPNAALVTLDRSWQAFRDGIVGLGEDGLWRPLGPSWGQYGKEPWLSLILHALDEAAHHGAEIALLRDLYDRRS